MIDGEERRNKRRYYKKIICKSKKCVWAVSSVGGVRCRGNTIEINYVSRCFCYFSREFVVGDRGGRLSSPPRRYRINHRHQEHTCSPFVRAYGFCLFFCPPWCRARTQVRPIFNVSPIIFWVCAID